MSIIRCWETNCRHNERYKKPHSTFYGYCKLDVITIGRQNTESIKCQERVREGDIYAKLT